MCGMSTVNLMQIKVVPHEMGACYLTAIRHRYILDIMEEVSVHHIQLQILVHLARHRYKLTANMQQVHHSDSTCSDLHALSTSCSQACMANGA